MLKYRRTGTTEPLPPTRRERKAKGGKNPKPKGRPNVYASRRSGRAEGEPIRVGPAKVLPVPEPWHRSVPPWLDPGGVAAAAVAAPVPAAVPSPARPRPAGFSAVREIAAAALVRQGAFSFASQPEDRPLET